MNEKIAAAFNAWMDDYVNAPDKFASTTADALAHMRERLDGAQPSYGDASAATLSAYLERV